MIRTRWTVRHAASLLLAAPLLAVLALGGCSLTGSQPSGTGPATTSVPAPSAPATPRVAEDYIIGPGDQISVFVYDSPQLSTEVPVRPDGRISTPLIQDIVAAGKTPAKLGEEMAERLKEFVKDPHVTIIVRSFVGPLDRQVRVIGEAADPQAIPYRDGMTVLDVMIVTKGLTKYAAGNRAVLVRHVRGKDGHDTQETIHVRLSDLMKDGDISQNMAVLPGDTLIIPQSWF